MDTCGACNHILFIKHSVLQRDTYPALPVLQLYFQRIRLLRSAKAGRQSGQTFLAWAHAASTIPQISRYTAILMPNIKTAFPEVSRTERAVFLQKRIQRKGTVICSIRRVRGICAVLPLYQIGEVLPVNSGAIVSMQ